MSNKSNNINLIEEYKESLTEQERIVLQIAIEHLESSFDIEKSIGYLQWISKHNGKSNK
jgi:hypothetical protein